jgi:hypothetical protein
METLTITPNHAKRRFTIRTNKGNKYRTNKMSKVEFEENLLNTQNDWQNFLDTSQDYYKTK